MIEIEDRYTGNVIKTVEADTLRDANLNYADLNYADLRDADLTGADLSGAKFTPIKPTEEEKKILAQIPKDKLDMKAWHCGTTHCLAGWAQVIAGKEQSGSRAYNDGCKLLPSCTHLFYCDKDFVLEQIRQYLEASDE